MKRKQIQKRDYLGKGFYKEVTILDGKDVYMEKRFRKKEIIYVRNYMERE